MLQFDDIKYTPLCRAGNVFDVDESWWLLQVDSGSYKKAVRRLEAVEALLENHALAESATLAPRLCVLERKEALNDEIRVARKEVRSATTLVFKDELKARRRVLRRLG